MLDDEYFMRQALQEAHVAFDMGEVPVGAVIVSNQRIIARAHNLTETLTDVTAHAEMQAITSAANVMGGKYLTDCTLYVTVEPCPMCAGALRWAQISVLSTELRTKKEDIHVSPPTCCIPKRQSPRGSWLMTVPI